MRPEDWRRIKPLLQSTLEREPGQRAAFLAEACAGDEALRHEVESLVACHEQAGSFFEVPAYELMAETLAADRPAALVGKKLGPYEILFPLGVGGMGEVYLAEDMRLGRKVALKILSPAFTEDEERLSRFIREAKAASALNHPNILTVYEFGQAERGLHFIATEFIQGQTLRERMAGTRMRLSEVLDVATQVGCALEAAHQEGIVHRDIKPENIMIRRDGYAKVLDFGLVKLEVRGAAGSSAARLVDTKPGVVMGTTLYMSPEQARGLEVDARTDIWSLGVVLYEMTGGRVPFEGATSSDVIASILKTEPEPLTRHRSETPAELQAAVTKALAKDTEERYRTITELLADLRRLRQRLELEAELGRSLPPDNSADAPAADSRAVELKEVAGPAARSAAPAARKRRSRKAIDSLATLPFATASNDPSVEYLSDGLTESIINTLSQLPKLRVMARSTVFFYKGRTADPQTVGRALGVRAVLTGRVLQVDDRFVIGAELVDTADGAQLWGGSINGNSPTFSRCRKRSPERYPRSYDSS